MSKKSILIIDDDFTGAKLIKEELQKKGFAVDYAYSGEDGLEKLKETTPDIILLDLVLPGESGFRIAQDIKSVPKFRDIPIIAISIKKENIDKHIASKCGFIGYVEKPLDLNNLLYVIKDILEG